MASERPFSLDPLEPVALLEEPFDGPGHRPAHIPLGLEGIVEDEDGAVARIAFHVLQDLLGREVRTVIARHDVPHHDAVRLAEAEQLRETHVPVGRTEQVAGDEAGGQLYVCQVIACPITDALDVVEGMVPHGMTTLDDHAEHVGMLAHIVAHHKEGGLHAVLVQRI